MLDDVTKKRINTLRQILVGKLPDPKAQVEQITNGLIYKFMNDMDEQSVSLGGKASYFSGKFEKYSWKNLMNSKTSGSDRLELYKDAIEKMYNNENLPELFREIFKNSFLPFKDPSTLNMFLKEINEFNYSNSEKLGDAFEYLLSFMGSQGDAGQFRTPRHIIDFIVEIVNPQKNETILDPACGTAGFLISSYKHILNQNTKKNLGDGLTASDRKKIGENLNGYDISPDMVKMSLVNMYLHKFTNPKINEYDTLSSEDKWNEYYDVILANPPFFSPKGGISPHKRFGVKSTKAEVLFIDYINEHLKPNGRAGIIVPEGVIFQTGNAYKQLRKKLLDTSLIGIISLPTGVFQPYSGVKTSVLILDKKLSKKNDKIFFYKVNNDGYSLNSNRTPINVSDLPGISEDFKKLKNSKNFILKERIINSLDFNLVYERYFETKQINKSVKFEEIGKYFDIINGGTPSRKNKKFWEGGHIPWFTIDDIRHQGSLIKETSQYITNQALKETSLKLIPKYSTLICCTASVGETAFNEIELTTNQQFNSLIVKNEFKEEINPKFIFWMCTNLKKEISRIAGTTSFKYLSVTNLKKIKIPIPKIEVQNLLTNELNGYEKIISGLKDVTKYYKPEIHYGDKLKTIKLGEICDFSGGTQPPKSTFINQPNKGYIRLLQIRDYKNDNFETYIPLSEKHKTCSEDDIMIGRYGPPVFQILRGKKGAYNVALMKCIPNHKFITNDWLYYFLNSTKIQKKIINLSQRVRQSGVRPEDLRDLDIPLPTLEEQNKICNELKKEYEIIDNNRLLIKNIQKKIEEKIKSFF